jgi:flagellar L-ring protein precursor FlgH
MRKLTVAVLCIGAAISLGSRAAADSLWTSEGRARSLYTDNKAHQVGDVLTIVVVETTTAASKADTKADSTDAISGGPGSGSDLFKFLTNLTEFKAETKSSTSGKGSTSRSGSLVARIAVVVKNILPNGSLVIEGSREVTINSEKQIMKLTGTIRPEDIGTDNTVLSSNVADAKIEYCGKGPVGRKQRGGLLTRIFDLLF